MIIESTETAISVLDESLAIPSTSEYKPQDNTLLSFVSTPMSSHLLSARVEVNEHLVDLLLNKTAEIFKVNAVEGFDQSNVPTGYIEELFKNEIINKAKNYLFHHVVIDFLINEILAHKISLVNYPRLNAIEMLPTKKMIFLFDISVADPIELKEWRHFAFKPPKRKRYRDLDKQVIAFIENKSSSKKATLTVVEEDDWVLFNATILDVNSTPISHHFVGSFWLRVMHQEISDQFSMQLLGKEIGHSFCTTHLMLQEAIQKNDDLSYPFLITIKALIKGCHFSIETFKNTFKLKNKAEVHNKLMEVFSYRNDVSQRKSTIEEIFHLLLSKHRFEVPKHLVLRREESIIANLIKQPDYHVYKSQKDFDAYVEMLAEKQLKEEIIIDQIAYNENVVVDIKDIDQYLHLLTNKRLKEFIYFKPLLENIEETCDPINASILNQSVMREKTLNHVINTLAH